MRSNKPFGRGYSTIMDPWTIVQSFPNRSTWQMIRKRGVAPKTLEICLVISRQLRRAYDSEPTHVNRQSRFIRSSEPQGMHLQARLRAEQENSYPTRDQRLWMGLLTLQGIIDYKPSFQPSIPTDYSIRIVAGYPGMFESVGTVSPAPGCM
ncbi:hypothetical protein ASPCAL01247 [Aspergillus calidoustus]|uniref:Uncharacterized protein n=1 Tax=Aspergillus calidoustus TaxID=454130 RepID=A0A0U5FQX2_ASPCI|nr:hypothetical protein ASPCAL01247 [Aspergillus calidoustus]